MTGTIEKIGQKEIKSEKLTVREIVIRTGTDQFPELVPMQLKNDKCSLVDMANVGDSIEVSFNIRGREWNGKYFTNLEAWQVTIQSM